MLIRLCRLAGLVLVAATVLAPVASAQVAFEQVTRDLASPDAGTRLAAVRLLKDAAYPEAAAPLAALITDASDQVQMEAIGAELNIFLVQKITPRKKVALVIEVRNRIGADAAFSAGPVAISSQPVPPAVLTALRTAVRDDTPAVGVEALYGLGTLGIQASGAARRDLLAALAPELAALTASPEPALRYGAVRVAGRLFAPRAGDAPVETALGDAVILALNDNDKGIRLEAMRALGAMRNERAVQALSELFQYYGKGDLAESALDAVARIGHTTGAPVLMAQLGAKASSTRGIAIEGLARLGDANQLPAIEAALQGEKAQATQLTGAFARARLGKGALEAIVEATRDAKLHDQAHGYLVEMAPTQASFLAKYARDPDANLRFDVANAVALAADPRLLPVLEPLLRDADARVKHAAERAQVRIGR